LGRPLPPCRAEYRHRDRRPAMIHALSILCAVLALFAWRFWTMFVAADKMRARLLEGLQNQIRADAALLAEAHTLLHDTAARGKDGRWIPWSERRAAWVKKCEVRG